MFFREIGKSGAAHLEILPEEAEAVSASFEFFGKLPFIMMGTIEMGLRWGKKPILTLHVSELMDELTHELIEGEGGLKDTFQALPLTAEEKVAYGKTLSLLLTEGCLIVF
ncbi:hypothetical protein IM40_05910 [Candidatus Paracaedimonas acanthamoebae]|nr:hypothetical protein IM40_05910 [Candidatus Paracaedimonas acanthamoebae]